MEITLDYLKGFDITLLNKMVSVGDIDEIRRYMDKYGLCVTEGKIRPRSEYMDIWNKLQDYLDKRQLVRKILLNSAYGALLNEHCLFFDKRMGQSTTLCGRQIVKHMSEVINYLICGEKKHDGDAVVYNDTDSAIFSIEPLLKTNTELQKVWDKDTAIAVYDDFAVEVNKSFPDFMYNAFHCPTERGSIIKAGREIVADRGIFVKKKKYAMNYFDKEGKRTDVDGKMGKLKVTGFDIKRSDTPKFVQIELEQILVMVLAGKGKEEIIERIKKFKEEMKKMKPWEKGSPKTVKSMAVYGKALDAEWKEGIKANTPGHVRAAWNWNYLRNLHDDKHSSTLMNGSKIVVCKLKNNDFGFSSIAYPVDQLRLPNWFTELNFDDTEMEHVLFGKKLESMLGVLNWNLELDSDVESTFSSLFSFD
jgi:DNA polymerase elongation subunit (family B)